MDSTVKRIREFWVAWNKHKAKRNPRDVMPPHVWFSVPKGTLWATAIKCLK